MKDYRIEKAKTNEHGPYWVMFWSGPLCGWIPSMPCDTRYEAECHIAALRSINARFA